MTDSTGQVSGAVAKVAAHPEVLAALRDASKATGVDFGYLVRTAQKESNFDPAARAPTSSATGLFQFTNETWLNMIDRYGAQHGVADGGKGMTREQILALRTDPTLSANMAAELAQENAKILSKKIGRQPTSAELYAAHFMGPTDAAHLIHAARRGDKGAASDAFQSAALANPDVFADKAGGQLTSPQLYQRLTGDTVHLADTGKASPAVFHSASDGPMAPGEAAWAARMGMTQLTSTLMAALFELQTKDGAG